MAWIYLAVSEASDSHSESGCRLSAIVSKTDTHKAYCCQGCGQVRLIELQSGMMCELCGEICWPQSTSSLVASPAKTSVLQDLVEAWLESEAAYSLKSSDLQKKLERRLCFSKTSQQLELEDFEKLSEHLPKWGMTVAGRVSLPQALEPLTSESDGFCWQTPTVQDANGRTYHNQRDGSVRLSLLGQIMYPTPTATDYGSNNHGVKEGKAKSKSSLCEKVGGQLNPMWVEWLMGYPIGWTELDALETQWCQSKRKKRLKD